MMQHLTLTCSSQASKKGTGALFHLQAAVGTLGAPVGTCRAEVIQAALRPDSLWISWGTL